MTAGLMAGKRGLIMGLANDKSIAWGIAKALADQGAELAFSYQGEAILKRVGPLAERLGSDCVIPCDVGDMDSVDALFASLEDEIRRAREYLESGEHEHWHGFRPLYVSKRRDGNDLPPHKDWVRSTFLPRCQKALSRAERALERIERKGARRSG